MAKKNKYLNEEVEIERFHPNYETGLTAEQIELRKTQGLVNKVSSGSNKTILSIFIKNIFTFFNIMFVFISILLISAKAPLTNFSFLLIITLNTVIGIIQEIRTKITIDKLSLEAAPNATVVRGGEKIEVKLGDVVLDDIIFLSPGKAVPTDSILEYGEVEVNESQLTGESVPVRKNIGDTLYSGSFVVSGNCYAYVERVGKDNSIEKIASAAKEYSKPKSEIMKSLGYLLKFVSIIFVPVAVILYSQNEAHNWRSGFFPKIGDFFNSFVNHSTTYSQSILSTSSALLGMIPSGLILLTTVALAVGVRRLAKHHTLVQDIYCIEMLAHVDVLCLDKTGTITDGTMTVTRFIEMKRNEYNVSDIVSSMNSALQESNSTSKALEAYFGFGKKYTPVEILAFSSENKYSAVTFEEVGTFILGAPEFVLKGHFDKVAEQVNEYANQGLRVLALAHSPLPLKDGKIQKAAKLVALILIEDQIRKEAYDTIKYFRENGVQVKVISGDNPVTVSEVARRVGIQDAEDYISLEGLTDEEVAQVANTYTVFGRVKPNQKKILVEALKKCKHTVAMTGDGVNDILALKEADCSIAMASGCDAVKNVAQLVLLDSNFASMPKVVGEGRRVINNIQQTASLYLVKTLFTMIIAILTMSGFLKAFSGSSAYPFYPSQLMLIEMFAIGIPSFALALQPNKKRVEGNFLINVIRKSLPGALTIGIQVCITYIASRALGFSRDEISTVIIFSATCTCLLVLYMACLPFNKWKVALYAFLVICCISIFTLSSTGVKITDLFGTGFNYNFQEEFSFMPLIKKITVDGKSYYDANALLLAMSLSAISYVIIIVINSILSVIDNIFKHKKESFK